MVTKLQKSTSPKTPEAKASPGAHLTGSVKDSAQQIWQAGLGAFAKAQAEGTRAFEALVKEGNLLQRKTQTAAEAANRLGLRSVSYLIQRWAELASDNAEDAAEEAERENHEEALVAVAVPLRVPNRPEWPLSWMLPIFVQPCVPSLRLPLNRRLEPGAVRCDVGAVKVPHAVCPV